jgi:hypothetical protein
MLSSIGCSVLRGAKGKLIRHLLEHSVESDVSMAALAEFVYES